MSKDNLSSLYKGLIKKGYSASEIGDEATFRSKMADKQNRKQLYDYVSSRGDFRIGDYDSYEKRLSEVVTDYSDEPQRQTESPAPVPVSVQMEQQNEAPVQEISQPRQQLPKKQRQSLKEQAEMAFAIPDEFDMAAKFADTPPVYDPNARLQKALSEGRLDTIIKSDEEERISAEFTPKPVADASDIYSNYSNRFSLTERGKQLYDELSHISSQIQEKYAKEFLKSDEYKALQQKYSGEELNRVANEAFSRAYSKRIDAEMEPYTRAYQKEAFSRYENEIARDLGKYQEAQKQNTKTKIASDVSSLTASVDNQLEENHRKLASQSGSGNNAFNALMGSRGYNMATAKDRKSQGELEAARALLEESQNIIDEARRKGKTNFVSGVGRGFADTAFNAETWSFGLSDMRDAKALMDALDKFDRGEELTQSEQTLMDAAVANMATNAYYYSDLGRGYKAGMVTGQSVPFMLEFAVNPVSASGSSIAKSILKYGMKKFGKSAVKNNAAKFAARLIGDATAAASMTGTSSAARVAAGTIERMGGDIQLDDTGTEYAGRKDKKELGESLGKSFASTFLENQSEMVFNAFSGLGAKVWKAADQYIPGGTAAIMDNAIMGKAGEIYRKIKSNPTLQEVAKRTQFHGLGEEYLEEVYNNFANIPLGEMTLEEATDLDNNIDTFLGLAPTSVAFGMLGLGGLANERIQHRKKIKAALGNLTRVEAKRLKKLEALAEKGGNEDIKAFIRETILDKGLTPEEKKAEIEYAYNLAVGNAIDDIDATQQQEVQENSMNASQEGAAIYAEHNPGTMRQTVLRREIAEQRLIDAGFSAEDIEKMKSTPVEERQQLLSSMDDVSANSATDFFNAFDREEAMNEALDTAHEDEVFQARNMLQDIVLPNQTVTVVPLGKYGTEQTQYGVVVSGIDAQGNPTQSNGAVVTYPVQVVNGVPDFSTIDKSKAVVVIPKSYTDAMIFSPDEAFNGMLTSYQQDAAILEGTPISPGAQFPVMLDDGSMQNITVAGTAPTGESVIVTPDGKTVNMPIEELSRRKRNAEQAPIMEEYAEEEQIQQQAVQEAATAGYSEEVKNLRPQTDERLIVDGQNAVITEISPDGLIVGLLSDNGDIIGTKTVPLETYYDYKQSQFNQQDNVQTQSDKNTAVPVNEQPAEGNAADSGRETADTEGTQQKEETDYPIDEAGEPAFLQMQPERTVQLLTDTFAEDAASFVTDRLSAAKSAAEKAAKKSPKALGFNQRAKELSQIREERENAAREVEYWQNIYYLMNPEVKPQPKAQAAPTIMEEAEAETRNNQERLAAMKEEEIAVAQAKVQNNIDKGKYDNKPADRKRARYVEQDNAMGEAFSPMEHVLREIATGHITFQWSDKGANKGLASHLGISGSVSERQKLIWALSNEGFAPEIAAEMIHANMPAAMQELVTDQDIFNMILDAFSQYGSPSRMFEAAQQLHGNEIESQKGYQEDMERQELEWEAYHNNMSVEDWSVLLDIVEEELEYQFRTLTDEGINNIFEEIYNEQYGTGRNEAESAESTQQSTDSEGGNEVQPQQQSDNETTDGGSEVRPQETAPSDEQGSSSLSQPGFTVEKRYHKKDNKDIFAVNFTERMERDIFLDAKKEAKNRGGYYSSFGKGGFIFETEEAARNFGELMMAGIVGRNIGRAIENFYNRNFEKEAQEIRDKAGITVDNGARNTILSSDSKMEGSLNLDDLGGIAETVDSHGLAKSNELEHLLYLLVLGVDPNRTFDTAPLATSEGQAVGAGLGTGSGHSYRTGLFIIASEPGGRLYHNGKTNIKTVLINDMSFEGGNPKGYEHATNLKKVLSEQFPQIDFILYSEANDYYNAVSQQSSIEAARAQVDQNPTEAQKEAGNYRKGHITIDGYNITLENPKGSERSGTDKDGKKWSVTMNNDYGYIRGTEGVDGDHIDVFLSDTPESGKVFVVDQVNEDGTFDEHKVMYGFDTRQDAIEAYLANYSPGWAGLGQITEVSKEQFRKWIDSSHRKTKPFAEYKSMITPKKPEEVNGYRKGDKVYYQGKLASIYDFEYDGRPVLDTGLAPVIYTIAEWEDISSESQQPEPKKKPSGMQQISVESLFNDLRTKGTTRFSDNMVLSPIEKEKNKLDKEISSREKELDDIQAGKKANTVYGNGSRRTDLLRGEIREFKGKKINLETLESLQTGVRYIGESGKIITILSEKDGNYSYSVEIDGHSLELKATVEQMGNVVGMEDLYPDKLAPATKKETTVDETPAYGSQNKLVSTARYEELRKRMRAKLNNLNAGYDPEIMAIGAEMAAYHIEAGARTFIEFAKRMITDMGDDIRPYLKSIYSSARHFPGMEAYKKAMTPESEYDEIDINSIKINEDEQRESNTETIVREAEAVASEAEAVAATGTTEQIEKKLNEIDSSLEKVNNQLALVGYYEADTSTPFHEVYGYAKSAEKKALADAKSFAKKLVKDLGVKDEKFSDKRRKLASANVAPAGGSITVNIPLQQDKVLAIYIPIDIDRGTDDMFIPGGIMYRIESGSDFSGGSNMYINEKSDYPTMVHAFRRLAKAYLPEQRETPVQVPVKPSETSSVGNLFTNENDVSLQSETIKQTDNEQERRSEKEDSGLGTKTQQEDAESDGDGMDRSSTGSAGTDKVGSGRGSVVSPVNGAGSTSGKRNERNNRNERGIDYAPKSPKARFDANIKAIKLMRQLVDSDTVPTRQQMEVLRKFSGWGGLGTFFNNEDSAEYKKLRELLSDEEFDAAAASINSAYYTPANIIDTLWDIAGKLGFKGGNILEGSAGIGNIIGSMPVSISENSNIEAVEIDPITGNILKLLYPDAKVNIQGFEETRVRNGSVDLAITNVPFVTGLQVHDPIDKDLSRKFRNIHDFCIAKNVRKLREGGIGIFITSSGTMDKSTALREWLVNEGNADFIGAFRLNNKTFEGASVTSDIIVVRKRIGKAVSPVAIDAVNSSIVRTGEYPTGESIWDNKSRSWVPETKKVTMEMNNYFQQHPENMAGEMAFNYEKGETRYPGSYALFPVKGKNQNTMLSEWADSFQPVMEKDFQPQQQTEIETEEKNGALFADEKGNFYVSEMGVGVPLNLNANKVRGYEKTECLRDYNSLKSSLDDVLEYQVNNQDDAGLRPLLQKLNDAYDTFTGKYGNLNKNTSISFLRNDVDFPSIAAIEEYKEYKNAKEEKVVEVNKTNVFKGRVIGFQSEPQPKNVKDGVIASLYKFGYIDLEYIAEKLGKTSEDVKLTILNEGIGFVNPESGAVEVRYEYLSGNVRRKLEQAKENNQNGEYTENIKALEQVMPLDIPAHLVDFSLGSSWIDPQLYSDFITEKFGVSDAKLKHVEGIWNLKVSGERNEKNRSEGVFSEKFNEVIYGTELVDAALNNKTIQVKKVITHSDKTKETIVDKEATQACLNRIQEIKDEFKEWMRNKMLQNEELATKVAKVYNEKFNNLVPKVIDEMFLPAHFGGSSEAINLYTHQKRAVIRGTTEPLLLAHEVGSGKTFTLISTAMEMRRLGTAKKPMIVVQNATVGQFVADAKKLYPNAKILTITERDRTPEGRRAFYGRIKYSDWDLIIIPQSTFDMIPDSPERQLTFIQEKIDEKQHAIEVMQEIDGDESQIKQLENELFDLYVEYSQTSDKAKDDKQPKKRDRKREEKGKQNIAARAKEQLDRKVDEVQYFDEMGIDAILVDEAHEYKRLGFSTAMTRGVKGIDPAGSKKAAGVYLKTRAVLEQNGWKNVIFATGTPISNTAAEIWTFMRYLMPKSVLKENEIYYFDDFVRNFGAISQSLEFATSGKFKENTRFAAYINKPELIRLWSSVSDTVLTKDISYVNDKIPRLEKDTHQDIFLPQSDSLISIMNAVRAQLEWFEGLTGKQKRENSHIPLTMYGIAKRAAIDTRLVDANAPDDPLSKTNKAVEETLKSLEETKDYKGTVAIFCDNQRRWDGNKVGFDLFEDMREKLISRGVPANQIIIMKPGMSVQKKQKIFDEVNAGSVRVIIGNTQTLGTGVNIQERLHTLIHMDAPDRPMDYTQRNGRILRQGNMHKLWNKPVRILRFGVEDSLDVTSYQRLKTKAGFIDSIMDGKAALVNNQENRTLEEEEEGLFDNPVAILSGSQYALLKNQAEREYRKFLSKKSMYETDQIYVSNRLVKNKQQLERIKSHIVENRQKLAKARELFPDGNVSTITIEGKKCRNQQEIDEALKELVNKKVRALEDVARKDPYFRTQSLLFKIKFDEVDTDIRVTLVREEDYDFLKKATRISVRRGVTYDIPAMGIKNATAPGGYVRNAIDDITKNVVNGKAFSDAVNILTASVSSIEEENKLLEQRKGKPFEFNSELEAAKEKVDEYTELMKAELAEKEAKYAGRGAANIDLSEIESEEEQTEAIQEEEVRFHIGESKNISGGRKITFTRRNPTSTFNALVKYLKKENVSIKDMSFASTGSKYIEYERNGVLYSIRSANHTKGYYVEHSNDNGLSLEWDENITDVEIDLSENDYGISEIKGIMDLVDTINEDGKGFNYFIENSVYPSEIYGKSEYAFILNEVVYRKLYKKKKEEDTRLMREAVNMYPYKSYVASNGIKVIHQGSFTPSVLLPQGWNGKTKKPSEDAIAEYMQSDSYKINQDIDRKRKKYIEDNSIPTEMLEKYKGKYFRTSKDILPDLHENKYVRETLPNYRFSEENDDMNDARQYIINNIHNEAAKLNISVTVYTSIDQIPQGAARRALEKGLPVKGWYHDGQIAVYLPNATNMEDIKATILHEGVAHYGLRKMVGTQNFNAFMDGIYAAASPEVRKEIVRLLPRYDYNMRVAVEEYLATLAESGTIEPTFWEKVKQLFRVMLENFGFTIELTDNDLRYILWESRNNLRKSNNPLETAKETVMRKRLGIGMFSSRKTEDTLFRFEDRPALVQEYDAAIDNNSFRFQEAFQDSMLSLKVLQELIERQSGKPIRTFENAYTAENRLSSINKVDNERYLTDFFEPLLNHIDRLAKMSSREQVEDYIYAKSGLERNEVFLNREAQKAYDEAKKELDGKLDKGDITQPQYDALMDKVQADYDKMISEGKDYSGLTGLVLKHSADELSGITDDAAREKRKKEIEKEYKEHAESIVSEFENKIPAAEVYRLWQLINSATNENLRKQFDSGMISAEKYEELKNMMQYYVPLRGWQESIAEDFYDYTRKETPVQKEKSAKGRKSLADNPIANIALSAQNAIILGNRNKMKQRFYNFIINRPNELVTVRDQWYARTVHTVHGQAEAVYPGIEETDDAKTIQQKLEEFEKNMKEMEELGLAFRRRTPLGVTVKVKQMQKPEHTVSVMINGQEYVMYINGNPRAAQALNGKTNPEGEENIFWEYYNKAKRFYGGGLTSNNPDFVAANFVRDSIHSATMQFLNNGIGSSARFVLNTPKSFKAVFRGVLGKYKPGSKTDQYFQEFIQNGGETGYTAVHTIEDYKHEYNKALNDLKGIKAVAGAGKKGLEGVIKALEVANRIAEDINRFNAYMSSREAGKTIEESIDAAKNITVNFNKKGALGKGKGAWAALAWFMNKWILFFNPAVQGLYQVGQSAANNKKRVAGTLATIAASGFIMPYLNSLLISALGGDGDDDYFNQTDYTRMNNWLIYIGNGYAKIPLPPFFREIYGLGDIFYRLMTGRITPERASVATLRQVQSAIGFINLIPEGEPNIQEAVSGVMPDIIAPLMDVAFNRDFTGRDIAKDTEWTNNLPEYERIYKGVSPVYVEFSRLLNQIGGDDARRSPLFGTFINPAYMEHIITAYTGGIGKTISNLSGAAADLAMGNPDNIEFRTIPVVNRFGSPVTERSVTSATNRVFFDYLERYEAMKVAEKRYKQFIKDGRKEFRQELEQMKKNGEIEMIRYFDARMKVLRKLQNALKENPDNKGLEKRITELKKEMSIKAKAILR